MKAVMAEVPPDILEHRRRTGADRWDEMWNGVLHMPPMPNRVHQDFEFQLEAWLREYWARPAGNRVFHNVNLAAIGGWPHDFRVPDLILLTPDRFGIDHNEYFEGPPLVIVEIHSPGDETYEKLDFYADLGVPEAWVIHRDLRKPEIYSLKRGEYIAAGLDSDGWLASDATGIRMRHKRSHRLVLQLADQEPTRVTLPE